MKVPFYKRWLSYLYPIILEAREGAHNPYLEVAISRGRFQLNTENAIYSFGDLYLNFFKTFQQLPLDKMNVQDVLILGFGLGSIPEMLEKNFKKNYRYTGVEIDEEVIDLAHHYVVQHLKSPIQLVCADAEIFAATCSQTFDLLCIDIFLDDVIPSSFEQVDFLVNVNRLLSSNGYLIINRLAFTKENREANKIFLKTFLQVFPNGRYLDLKDNWMFINH